MLARSARDDRGRFGYQLERIFEISMIAGVWVGIVLGVGAHFAIRVVAGNGFGPSVVVLQILAVSTAATFLLSIGGFALLALRRHAQLLIANGIALVLAVGLTLALAPAHGAKGAAIATAVTEFVLAGTYAVMLLRREPDLRPSLIVLPKVLLAAAAAVAAGVLPSIPDVVGVVVSSAVYLVLLLVLRGIPAELFEAFGLRRRRAG
jgi:O-antigen/teichoic acid export membrane protein